MRKWILFGVMGIVLSVAAVWHFHHTNQAEPLNASNLLATDAQPVGFTTQELKQTSGEIILGGGPAQEIPVPVATPPAPKTEVQSQPMLTKNTTPTKPTSDPAVTTPRGEQRYKIESGDTLGGIAKKKMGSSSPKFVDAIMKKNGIKNPNQLKIGMELVIPDPASVKAK